MIDYEDSDVIIRKLLVLSTDIRPEDSPTYRIGSGSRLYELDGQKRVFKYSAKNLNPVTGDHWWEV